MLFRKKNAKDEPAVASSPARAAAEPPYKLGELDEDAPELAPVATTATEDIVYPSGLKLAFLLSSVFVSIFLVSLVGSP